MDGDTRRKLSKEPLRDTNQVVNKSRKVDFNVLNVDFIDGCLPSQIDMFNPERKLSGKATAKSIDQNRLFTDTQLNTQRR